MNYRAFKGGIIKGDNHDGNIKVNVIDQQNKTMACTCVMYFGIFICCSLHNYDVI